MYNLDSILGPVLYSFNHYCLKGFEPYEKSGSDVVLESRFFLHNVSGRYAVSCNHTCRFLSEVYE